MCESQPGQPAFRKVISECSTFAPSFGKATSLSSLGPKSFQKTTSKLSTMTPQKVIPRLTSRLTLDVEFGVEDGCDEIMNDLDFLSYLAASRLRHEPIIKQEEEEHLGETAVAPPEQHSCKNQCSSHATNEAYNQEDLWRRNALEREPANKQFDPALPSSGTGLHLYGGCIPCDYFASEEGCTMGRYCGFCHFSHPVDEHSMKKTQRRISAVEFEAQMREERCVFNRLQAESMERKATNIGSHTHFTGRCNPCKFIHKMEGCKDGEECIYCHICDEAMRRMKKSTGSKVGKRIKKITKNKRNASSFFA